MIVCFAFPLRVFAAGEKRDFHLDQGGPIRIVSDRLEAFQDEKKVIFSGHAIATHGERVIKADIISLFYHKEAAQGKPSGSGTLYASGDLERIVATGNVRITERDRVVTGNEAVFLQDAQKIIMTGNAVLQEGKNIIRGERVLVYLEENRGVVESEGSKRVTAIFYPKEQSKVQAK